MAGSGKTEVCNYLNKKGYPKIYFGDITFEQLAKRNLAVSEKNEWKVREELRKKYGMAAYAVLNLPKIKKSNKQKVVLLESLYSWEEYEVIKKEFGDKFKVLAVHAAPETRYARLKKRPKRPLTKKEAQGRDKAQVENSHIAGPISMADYVIINEGNKKSLFKETEKALRVLSV